MNINKTNYESWFLDYFEGTLSTMKVAELFLFLHQHPELQPEFDAFQLLHLSPPENAIFDAKESMKRGMVSNQNIDYYLVGEMEYNLTLVERTQLKEFLQKNPVYEKDRELYRKTKLPVTAETFRDKKLLKKKILVPRYKQFNFWMATAAIIIMVLGIIYITRPGDENRTAQNNIEKEDTTSINNKTEFAQKSNSLNAGQEVDHASIDKHPKEEELPVASNKMIIQRPAAASLLASEDKNSTVTNVAQKNKRSVRVKVKNIANTTENIAMAERKGFELINNNVVETTPVKRDVTLTAAMSTNFPGNQHRTTFNERVEDLKTATADKVNKVTGEEILYNQRQQENPSSDRLPFKSRMIKLLAWSLNKISGDRVQMKTDFDHSGNLAAYEISAGKLKVERGF